MLSDGGEVGEHTVENPMTEKQEKRKHNLKQFLL